METKHPKKITKEDQVVFASTFSDGAELTAHEVGNLTPAKILNKMFPLSRGSQMRQYQKATMQT
jgi:hypothetical protein